VTSPDFYPEYKFKQNQAVEEALNLIPAVSDQYREEFGLESCGLVEGYRLEDAEHAIVAMGSIVSTVRILVDELRKQGKKIGLLKVKTWRPFPAETVFEHLKNTKYVTVLDKNIVFGVGGALATDIKAALYGRSDMVIGGCIIGLGGAKSGLPEIQEAIAKTENSSDKNLSVWIGI
jgi:pyruvate ferredoxin oxidoreductase alpha subunit